MCSSRGRKMKKKSLLVEFTYGNLIVGNVLFEHSRPFLVEIKAHKFPWDEMRYIRQVVRCCAKTCVSIGNNSISALFPQSIYKLIKKLLSTSSLALDVRVCVKLLFISSFYFTWRVISSTLTLSLCSEICTLNRWLCKFQQITFILYAIALHRII